MGGTLRALASPVVKIPLWLAKTPSGRKRQLNAFLAAKARIIPEIRVNRGLPSSLRRVGEDIKISPADEEAVIGRDKLKMTRPSYNLQYMCDFGSDVILSYGVFCKKNNTGTLISMIQNPPARSRKNHRASRWDFLANPAGLPSGTFGV